MNKMIDEMEKTIVEIFNEVLKEKLSVEQIKNMELSQLRVNSMSFLVIITKLEDAFGIEFDDNEITYNILGNFDDLCKLIKSKM